MTASLYQAPDTVVHVEELGVDPEQFVEYRLIRVADRLRRRFDDALRPHGLSARQFSVLAVLRARPGVTSAELARAVLMTPQSMGALVDQLERAGLVQRRPRRGKGVPAPTELSAAGEETLDAAAATVTALEEHTRHALDDDLAPLLRGLDRLSHHLDKH